MQIRLAIEKVLSTALLLWAALCTPSTVLAQSDSVSVTDLQGQAMRAPDSITSLGPDDLGDTVNLFNGALAFSHTDTSLPGNSQLAVAFTRQHTAGRSSWIRTRLGDWDIDLPRIGGSFARPSGWVNAAGGTNRCSNYSAPPTAYAPVTITGGTAVAGPTDASAASAATSGRPAAPVSRGAGADAGVSKPLVAFAAYEFWQGNSLHIPGEGGHEVLLRQPGDVAAPADGYAYPLVTKTHWQIRCLPAIQNAAGEGFVAISPQGVQYRFDWQVSTLLPAVRKGGASLGRSNIDLVATRVTDRFGNWVSYTYDPAMPGKLLRIDASDDRVIKLTYDGNNRVASVNDGTRTWIYGYSVTGELSRVTQPDGSYWEFNLRPLVHPFPYELGEGATCDTSGYFPENALVGTVRHPSGLVGTFETHYTGFSRSNVTTWCTYAGQPPAAVSAVWPRNITSQALTKKSLSGPGLGPLEWKFEYQSGPSSWAPCGGSCADTRALLVTDPQRNVTRYSFGVRFQETEGLLLQLDEGCTAAGALRSTTYHYRAPQGMQYPEPAGQSIQMAGDFMEQRHRPEDLRLVTQQGVTFRHEVQGFDAMVRPTQVFKASSLGYSLTDTIDYFDHARTWTMGQLLRLTQGGVIVQQHDYNLDTATRKADYEFGHPTNSYTHNPDGTLSTLADAAGQATTFQNFKRGKPQRAVYADQSVASHVVNNLGDVASVTNEAGTTTSYTFDAMGRVASINYPTGDPVAYYPTLLTFEQVGIDEWGLSPGHWRQTITTGNAVTRRWFDAMRRVRLQLRYDAANPSGTSSYVESRYDAAGRKVFESYPVRSFGTLDGNVAGRTTSYDALNRVVRQTADSEVGPLTTTTDYLSGFQRRVTNPRGYATTYAFQAFDAPNEDHITRIQAPEGVTVTIARDLFGKPTSISRGGGGAWATRSYVYDAYQRLCMTIEPETGATMQGYDPANNLMWRAAGLPVPDVLDCTRVSVPEARKVGFGYDARHRLTTTVYGDGSPGIGRSYTADGLLEQIRSGNTIWTYDYYNRRLPKSEEFTFWAGATLLKVWRFTWGLDSHGNVDKLNDPWGSMTYAPNALGQPTEISGYATAITHHPNGAVAGYTLNNGVSHSVTLNLRGLPQRWQDGGVTFDQYGYDADGNVTRIDDLQEGASNRSMSYDGLDRLKAANGPWGAGSYDYDALDNLRISTVGARVLSHNFDANNRLISLTGSQNIGIGYDANGNITQRGSQAFAFDIGNRMQSAPGKVNAYVYDGHGRRSQSAMADGNWRLYAYGRQGKLLFSYSTNQGYTRYVYLGDKLIAETGQAATTYSHTDALGSPVAKTNAIGDLISRTRYEPYGATASGANPMNIGFTGHVNDVDTGLVYMQQRYYDPIAGRFLSVDPVTTDTKSGSHFSRYAYVNNNPYQYIDPTGELPEVVEKLNQMVTGPYGRLADQAFSQGNVVGGIGYSLAGAGFGAANFLTLGEGAAAVKLGIATVAKLGEAAGVGSAAKEGVNTWWVGADGRAAAVASGGTTLASSQSALSAAAAGNIKAVAAESATAAKAATGPQKVFIGEGSGKVFYQKELPNLLQNMDKGKIPSIEINF